MCASCGRSDRGGVRGAEAESDKEEADPAPILPAIEGTTAAAVIGAASVLEADPERVRTMPWLREAKCATAGDGRGAASAPRGVIDIDIDDAPIPAFPIELAATANAGA